VYGSPPRSLASLGTILAPSRFIHTHYTPVTVPMRGLPTHVHHACGQCARSSCIWAMRSFIIHLGHALVHHACGLTTFRGYTALPRAPLGVIRVHASDTCTYPHSTLLHTTLVHTTMVHTTTVHTTLVHITLVQPILVHAALVPILPKFVVPWFALPWFAIPGCIGSPYPGSPTSLAQYQMDLVSNRRSRHIDIHFHANPPDLLRSQPHLGPPVLSPHWDPIGTSGPKPSWDLRSQTHIGTSGPKPFWDLRSQDPLGPPVPNFGPSVPNFPIFSLRMDVWDIRRVPNFPRPTNRNPKLQDPGAGVVPAAAKVVKTPPPLTSKSIWSASTPLPPYMAQLSC
jgi:hypothetical protein